MTSCPLPCAHTLAPMSLPPHALALVSANYISPCVQRLHLLHTRHFPFRDNRSGWRTCRWCRIPDAT